ncbi:MAG: transporter ATP-binding protein [Glaciihabitans sp.]|nr:transporter ATP-binding protein [Glaciihabitans sp.]
MTVKLALEAHDLFRFFRSGDEETLALRGVSLAVDAGEIVAVTGPSGSGKSTLLACLAGLDEPAGGSAWIAGERMSHQPEADRALLRARLVGVLFQSSNLFSHLSVTDNVRLAQGIVKARTNPERREAPGDIIGRVGLTARAHAFPAQLSGGENARAGLAVALANDPPVILADEPTGELDGGTEGRLLDLLRSHADRGAAILVVTHSPDVVRHADRVIELEDGKVVS